MALTKSSLSRYPSDDGWSHLEPRPETVAPETTRRPFDEHRHRQARREPLASRRPSRRCRPRPTAPLPPGHVHGEVGGLPRAQAGHHGAAVGRARRRGRTHPDRQLHRGAAPGGPPVHGRRLDREPAAEAAGPALPGRAPHRRAAGDRRRPRHARPRARAVSRGERRRGGRPQQRPARQPGLDQGGHRHRGAEPGPRRQAARQGPGLGPSRAGDGRRQRLRPGRQHRRDARCGRLPHRGAGADPVRAPDRRGLRGAGAGDPAHDQQVLRARPRPGAQPRRVRRPAGQADVRHLLAQPGLAARHLEPRHLRPCRPRRPRGRGGDHGQRADGARRSLLRRHPREHRRRPT